MNPERISIFGMGYVGLCSAVCFALRGFRTIGMDIDKTKIEAISEGRSPFFESGLETALRKSTAHGNLSLTTDVREAVEGSDISFITVGTPTNPRGGIDLTCIKAISRNIGDALKQKLRYHLVVVKSTVIPGTTKNTVRSILEKQSEKRCGPDFGLCVNPEFLKEGSAMQDTLNPDRIIIGEYDNRSGTTLQELYKRFYGEKIPPILRTNLTNAELIKYANNAFLAMKISFINQIANLCQRIPNADVEVIARGIGLDRRVEPSFLKAGLGWGGSCFPKDLTAFLRFSKSKGASQSLIEAALCLNQVQPLKAVKLAERLLNGLEDMRVAILGLSFKPGTDDMRNAVSIEIVKEFLRRKAKISAHDPVALGNAKRIFGDEVEYCRSALECICGADCAIIVTEWPEFSKLGPEDFISRMRNSVVIDGRRLYDPKEFSSRLTYAAIGLGTRLDHSG